MAERALEKVERSHVSNKQGKAAITIFAVHCEKIATWKDIDKYKYIFPYGNKDMPVLLHCNLIRYHC